MALYPGAGGDNILGWRGISALAEEIRARKAERISRLHHHEGLNFLMGFRDRMADELAFEAEFSAHMAGAVEQLEEARSEELLEALLGRCNQLAREYFIRRGSVVALQQLSTGYRDRVVARVLQLVETGMEQEGQVRRPAPYCWIACGSTGRKEQALCSDPSWFLIHGDIPPEEAGWFANFSERSLALLERIGLIRDGGHKPVKRTFRFCSRTAWQREIVRELQQDEPRQLVELVRRADLRLICGNTGLAEEAIGMIRDALQFPDNQTSAKAFRMLGKSIAELSTGVDFFSRLRLEKSGRNRGKFNLERYALDPLVANVRMLSINYRIGETDTLGRIKALLEHGCLSVDLAERLLLAWHDFTVFKIRLQLVEGCEKENDCCIDPPPPGSTHYLRLRDGLEAVAGLEKIAYLCFSDHG